MLKEKKLPIELTGMEVFYLEDVLLNGDKSEGLPDQHAYKPQGRELLLLVGGAFNELVTMNESGQPMIRPDSVTLYLTEEQVWLLRQKTHSSTVGFDQQTNIGIPLLRKFYSLLLRFCGGLEDWPVAQEPYDDLSMEDFETQLKEYIDANGNTD